MSQWIPIRVKTEPAKMRYVKAKIEGFPEEALGRYYFQQLQSLLASAADVMKNYIEYDPSVRTQTGWARAALGGNGPGRKDTGALIDGITWSGRKVADGKYSFEVGWLNGTPGYAIFQEQGTKTGVRAMNSLEYVTNFIRQELQLLKQNPRAYRVTRAAKWGGR